MIQNPWPFATSSNAVCTANSASMDDSPRTPWYYQPLRGSFWNKQVDSYKCGGRTYRAAYVINGCFAVLGVNMFFAFVGVNVFIGALAINSVLSFASINSLLSVGSMNCILCAGCRNSFLCMAGQGLRRL